MQTSPTSDIGSWEMSGKSTSCTFSDTKQQYPLSKSKIPFKILGDRPSVCVRKREINPVLVVRGGDALRLYFPLMRS